MNTRHNKRMIDVLGLKIFFRVIENLKSKDNHTYLLCLPDIPGYDHVASLPLVERLQVKVPESNMPHVILIDFPGCGQSEKSDNPAKEYTIDHFTTVTAFIIEHIKKYFCPENTMQLIIHGGALGSAVAMNLPLKRSNWTNESSSIRIKQIISCGSVNQNIDSTYSTEFLFSRFYYHRDYENMLQALTKLSLGDIKDSDDYISNIVFPLAPLMSRSYAGVSSTYFGSMLRAYPSQTITALRAASYIGSLFSRDTSYIDSTIRELTTVSLDVMKFFFSREFKKVDLKKIAEENADLYSKVQLTFLSGDDDFMANQVNTLSLRQTLPHMSVIILHDRHQTLAPENQSILDDIFASLICKKQLDLVALQKNFVAYYKALDANINKQNVERDKAFTNASANFCFKQFGITKTETAEKKKANKDKTEMAPVMSSGNYQPVNNEEVVIEKVRKRK